ncbi:sterol 3-beta-glucosyltransferase UGT80A2-like isoform X5 [Lycium barbarum]|nr:sterol 3-beta-glucosyltransferase UGT80A2-like isoform X5 [Lycium barbarum]XP_060181274.1 sterol 3-beta-glucosyltransferase UGT80A2-like isoform X5 [Lycium barbarum]
MTQIIVEALELTGQRGIINKGWGGLGNLAEPKGFCVLARYCPHDWLFLQCFAAVHHGGAGTTAAGLKAAVKEHAVELAKAMENEDGVTQWRTHVQFLGAPAPIKFSHGVYSCIENIKETDINS